MNRGVVDISVDMTFHANLGANTAAYTLLISVRKIKFQIDGKKMNVKPLVATMEDYLNPS